MASPASDNSGLGRGASTTPWIAAAAAGVLILGAAAWVFGTGPGAPPVVRTAQAPAPVASATPVSAPASPARDKAAIEKLLRDYVTACGNDDPSAALAMWSTSVRSSTTVEQFSSSTGWQPGMSDGTGPFIFAGKYRDRLEGKPLTDKMWFDAQTGDTAEVGFQVDLGAEMGFSGQMKLLKENGVWRIDECKMGSAGV